MTKRGKTFKHMKTLGITDKNVYIALTNLITTFLKWQFVFFLKNIRKIIDLRNIAVSPAYP